jgi:Uma2 family endonuclease
MLVRFSDVDEKVDAYLSDGVRLIWVIDPQRKKLIAHAPDFEQPVHYAAFNWFCLNFLRIKFEFLNFC